MAAVSHTWDSSDTGRKTGPLGSGTEDSGWQDRPVGRLDGQKRQQIFSGPGRGWSWDSHVALGKRALRTAEGEPAEGASIRALPRARRDGFRYRWHAPQDYPDASSHCDSLRGI